MVTVTDTRTLVPVSDSGSLRETVAHAVRQATETASETGDEAEIHFVYPLSGRLRFDKEPEEADRAEVAVHLFPYPEWVPEPLLGAAHDLHPIVANLLGAVTLVGPLALLYRVLLDGAQPIARVRQGRLYPLRRG